MRGTEGGHQGFGGAVLAAHLREAKFVVADPATRELYLFGDDGQLRGFFGGTGEGPGEYRGINFIGVLSGDSIGVADPVLHRFTVLDSAGVAQRTVALPSAGPVAPFAVNGILADGRLVATTFFPIDWRPIAGVQRDTMPIVVLHPSGAILSTVGQFPGPEGIVSIGLDNVVSTRKLPFGRLTRQSVLDSFVAVGVGDRPEIVVHAPDGRIVRIIRWVTPTVEITPGDIADFTRNRLASAPADPVVRAQLAESIRSAPMPRFKPPYDLILSRTNGELWVRQYADPHARDRPAQWIVFDSSGAWLTRVTLPAGVEPKWIGADRLLGVWQDQDDLYRVGLFRLRTGQ
ncbi:MAG: hypothetical protein ABIS00_15395 [Gemmatimonadales bacterium]